jgi:hypothetical protein
MKIPPSPLPPPNTYANNNAQERSVNKQQNKSLSTSTDGFLHDNFANESKCLIEYSADLIAQDDLDESESVDYFSDDLHSYEVRLLAKYMTPMGNEQRTRSHLFHHKWPVETFSLDTSLIDLNCPTSRRKTLDEQHQVSGLQSRGEPNATEADQLLGKSDPNLILASSVLVSGSEQLLL